MSPIKPTSLAGMLLVLLLSGMTAGCSNGDKNSNHNGNENERRDSENQVEGDAVGTISWSSSEPQLLNQVRCGSRGDEFVMNALGDNFNLRIYFRDPDGGTAVDFSSRRSFDFRFDRNHHYSQVRFYYPNYLESDGHFSASPEGAKGEAKLINPINVNEIDLGELPGSILRYDFTCSHDLNGRSL